MSNDTAKNEARSRTCKNSGATPRYVVDSAWSWMNDNTTLYKGNNASDCMVAAYIAGMSEIINSVKFDLLPACTDALAAVSKCLNDDGDRCAPNMGDFVSVANALTIIDDFYSRVNRNT